MKQATKEMLIHFDGWNSRYDVWLPHNSPRIRIIQTDPIIKHKVKEKVCTRRPNKYNTDYTFLIWKQDILLDIFRHWLLFRWIFG